MQCGGFLLSNVDVIEKNLKEPVVNIKDYNTKTWRIGIMALIKVANLQQCMHV